MATGGGLLGKRSPVDGSEVGDPPTPHSPGLQARPPAPTQLISRQALTMAPLPSRAADRASVRFFPGGRPRAAGRSPRPSTTRLSGRFQFPRFPAAEALQARQIAPTASDGAAGIAAPAAASGPGRKATDPTEQNGLFQGRRIRRQDHTGRPWRLARLRGWSPRASSTGLEAAWPRWRAAKGIGLVWHRHRPHSRRSPFRGGHRVRAPPGFAPSRCQKLLTTARTQAQPSCQRRRGSITSG